jgi:hypothetical protein
MPDGHETRDIFLINEMCMKAYRSGNADSLKRAISAAREQGLGQSIICKATEALLKTLNQKEPEFHDASEYTGEWQDWVEHTGEPFFDKWAARSKNEPMPLLQTESKESMEHQQAFRNWASWGISPEGVSIASTLSDASSKRSKFALERTGSNRLSKELCRDELPIIPETLHTDTASSSSDWQKVDESEILCLKKKHNKIITTTHLDDVTLERNTVTHKDEDTADCKWL